MKTHDCKNVPKLLSRYQILDSRRGGFTLIELLVFAAIFAGIMTAFIAILVAVTGIQARQASVVEVNQQSQFLLQQIQYYVERSSVIELPENTATTTLKLRMPATAEDPTYITTTNGIVYLQQTDTGTQTPLTSNKVTVSNLTFTKRSNAPSHDSVSVSFIVSYNTTSLKQQFQQTINVAIARVSAATFDSNVIPSSTATYDLGVTANTWRSVNSLIYFSSGNVGIGSGASSPVTILDVDGALTLRGIASSSVPASSTTNQARLYFDTASSTLKVSQNGQGYALLTQWTTTSTTQIYYNDGNVGIGTANPSSTLSVGANTFVVNSSGNIMRINNIGYSFPSSQGAASTTLVNNGSGGLRWEAAGSSADGAGVRQSFRNLTLRTGPSSDVAATKVTLIHADEIVTSDGVRRTPADNLSAVITTSGIGGLRASQAEAASTWYKVMYTYGGSGEGLYLEQALDYSNDQSQTTQNSQHDFTGTGGAKRAMAQSFQLSAAGKVPFVDVYMKKTSSPTGHMQFSIRADSSGNPGSIVSGYETITFDISKYPTSFIWIRVPFYNASSLSSATTYWLYANTDCCSNGVNASNYPSWGVNTAGGYASGTFKTFDGDTSTWTDTTHDGAFKIYRTRNDNTVTPPTGYATGYALIGWVYNDSSSNFVPFMQQDRKVRPYANQETANFAGTDPTLQDISSFVPPTPLVIGWAFVHTNAAGNYLAVSGVPDGFASGNPSSANVFGTAGMTIAVSSIASAAVQGYLGEIPTGFQAIYGRASGNSSSKADVAWWTW